MSIKASLFERLYYKENPEEYLRESTEEFGIKIISLLVQQEDSKWSVQTSVKTDDILRTRLWLWEAGEFTFDDEEFNIMFPITTSSSSSYSTIQIYEEDDLDSFIKYMKAGGIYEGEEEEIFPNSSSIHRFMNYLAVEHGFRYKYASKNLLELYTQDIIDTKGENNLLVEKVKAKLELLFTSQEIEKLEYEYISKLVLQRKLERAVSNKNNTIKFFTVDLFKENFPLKFDENPETRLKEYLQVFSIELEKIQLTEKEDHHQIYLLVHSDSILNIRLWLWQAGYYTSKYEEEYKPFQPLPFEVNRSFPIADKDEALRRDDVEVYKLWLTQGGLPLYRNSSSRKIYNWTEKLKEKYNL